jgi:YbgC/YbaW family acyl-CoA thioester hydrolase
MTNSSHGANFAHSCFELSVFPLTVQFEDLDAVGVVHHPTYLKYCERARCEGMREKGFPFSQCLAEGLALALAEVNIRYLKPGRMGDRLFVVSVLSGFKKSSLRVNQVILPQPPPLLYVTCPEKVFQLKGAYFQTQMRLVHIDLNSLKPVAMGECLRAVFDLKDESADAADPRFGKVHLKPDWYASP